MIFFFSFSLFDFLKKLINKLYSNPCTFIRLISVTCSNDDLLALCLRSYILILLLLLRAGDVESNPGPVFHSNTNDNGCLSIAHLNIRSIRNKLNYVTDHLSDFDIICFTETHLDGYIANSDLIIDVHESCIYMKDLNSHSGGLLVYVSDKLVSKDDQIGS